MTISPIDPTTATASAAQATTGTGSLSDPNTFLKLLVAELKYQNPMNPSDPSQYLGETAQFTMVQKLDSMESEMTSLLAATQRANASSLIDRQIIGTTATGQSVRGQVTGIDLATGTPALEVGSQEVPITNVTAIASPSTTTPGAAGTTH